MMLVYAIVKIIIFCYFSINTNNRASLNTKTDTSSNTKFDAQANTDMATPGEKLAESLQALCTHL